MSSLVVTLEDNGIIAPVSTSPEREEKLNGVSGAEKYSGVRDGSRRRDFNGRGSDGEDNEAVSKGV